ncbi:TPA: TPM domain-containing protein [Pasteurella multocida]|uniref:TPM domain-containing protein n=1 Tax=Pasteurella multocida TaxID=747 RepID=UPI000CE8FB97|nr:TPM domain-containing protein [Pasteurella multocida]MEB3468936.1 TPM domain-containing protein [Pasteurella multocida]MEB3473057.1 TPM domain-containing protein [Pasteurella multocida]MEB3477488.1 TPM domain-containing protein [Pasteurella multocida]MEB3482899.1 TPM domain-containing protein [Pasteurella multocida]MEB3486233.1 TPM domain-containing protein [Pasteurella multocida]
MPLFSKIPIDKQQVEKAIFQLEKQTSAELRVYVERKIPRKVQVNTGFERALQIFDELGMQTTEAHNGVLIYVAFREHQCAIIGDQGIHQYVGDAFWQQQCELMISHFRQNAYTQGIIVAIDNIAKELANYFPIQPDDKNELDNEVIING